MKVRKILSTITMLSVAGIAAAETLDGGQILEREAEKARQIEDLEYQANLVEQKAKLAKAYKNLHESGGFIPGEDFASSPSSRQSGAEVTTKLGKMPALKSISGQSAVFEINGVTVKGKPGSELPGGFVVLSVNAVDGVRVKHANNIYGLEINWSE